MKKKLSQNLMRLLILISSLLAICLCASYFIARSAGFFASPPVLNYLWVFQIKKDLGEIGYPIHRVFVTGSESPSFGEVDIQVGNQIDGKQQRTYELVKSIHEIVVKTYQNMSPQPERVSGIVITVIDYSRGSYIVGIDFETAQKYHLRQISEETYFEHWSFPPNIPDLDPP